MNSGVFTISLDFELHWGVSHRLTVEQYKANLDGTRYAIDATLKLFEKHGIHATWATVGFLFGAHKDEILNYCPDQRPNFHHQKFNNYRYLDTLGDDEYADPYHYAWEVVKKISMVPFQEIATHTFSHLFTLENGVTADDFENDLVSAISIAKAKGISIKSIVFPRNQYNDVVIEICNKYGINYRGNPDYFYHNPMQYDENWWYIRLMRGADSYLSFFPKICFEGPKSSEGENKQALNIPGSRFLRPFSKRLKLLEPLKIKRIKSELEYAAKNNKLYHLWWHPHNFGVNTKQNIENLSEILHQFNKLQTEYGMQSKNMGEFS